MPDPDPPLEGDTFPVAVIEGMNHYQWGSEEPPTLEKKRDIQAQFLRYSPPQLSTTIRLQTYTRALGRADLGGGPHPSRCDRG